MLLWKWPPKWRSGRYAAVRTSVCTDKQGIFDSQKQLKKWSSIANNQINSGSHTTITVIPKFCHFHNFFIACSNSSKSEMKFFFKGSRGTPWPIYFENYQLNIDFYKSSLYFQCSREKFSYFAHNDFLVME